jgi:hypothetical protein
MRKAARSVLASLVVVAIAVGWASAGSRGIAQEETLTVFSETKTFKSIDAGKPGSSVGDQDLVVDRVFSDSAKTHQIGVDRVVQEYIPNSYAMVQVVYSIRGRGDIYLAGTLNFSEDFLTEGDDLPILGGTDEFEGVSGSAHLSVFDNETFQADLHLIP